MNFCADLSTVTVQSNAVTEKGKAGCRRERTGISRQSVPTGLCWRFTAGAGPAEARDEGDVAADGARADTLARVVPRPVHRPPWAPPGGERGPVTLHDPPSRHETDLRLPSALQPQRAAELLRAAARTRRNRTVPHVGDPAAGREQYEECRQGPGTDRPSPAPRSGRHHDRSPPAASQRHAMRPSPNRRADEPPLVRTGHTVRSTWHVRRHRPAQCWTRSSRQCGSGLGRTARGLDRPCGVTSCATGQGAA